MLNFISAGTQTVPKANGTKVFNLRQGVLSHIAIAVSGVSASDLKIKAKYYGSHQYQLIEEMTGDKLQEVGKIDNFLSTSQIAVPVGHIFLESNDLIEVTVTNTNATTDAVISVSGVEKIVSKDFIIRHIESTANSMDLESAKAVFVAGTFASADNYRVKTADYDVNIDGNEVLAIDALLGVSQDESTLKTLFATSDVMGEPVYIEKGQSAQTFIAQIVEMDEQKVRISEMKLQRRLQNRLNLLKEKGKLSTVKSFFGTKLPEVN